MNWTPCKAPAVKDVIRWTEPLWSAPTKKRGKPDQIGEQMVTAEVTAIGEVIELIVESIEVTAINEDVEAPLKVTPGDAIRRKKTSIDKGDCHKRHGAAE